jgi:hypothetical protein
MAKKKDQSVKFAELLRGDLGLIEAELEMIMRDLYNINYEIATVDPEISEGYKTMREIQAAQKMAVKMGATFSIGGPYVDASPPVIPPVELLPLSTAYHNAFALGIDVDRKVLQEAAGALTVYQMADNMARLGTFYSEKLGLALLSRIGVMVTVYFDTPSMKYAQDALERLANEDFLTGILGESAIETEDQIGNMLIRVIRQGMATIPIPAIGLGASGGYAAPITSTGNLARSIGRISSGVGGPRRLRRGRRSKREAHHVSVGLTDPNNRSWIYGHTLAKALPSKPPYLSAGRWGKSAWDRIYAWADRRGIGRRAARFIGGKIFKQGSYGRAWMSAIIQRLDLTMPRSLSHAFGKKVERMLGEK